MANPPEQERVFRVMVGNRVEHVLLEEELFVVSAVDTIRLGLSRMSRMSEIARVVTASG